MQSKLSEVTVLYQALAFSGIEGRAWAFCLYILAADKAEENQTGSIYTELGSVWLLCESRVGVELASVCASCVSRSLKKR